VCVLFAIAGLSDMPIKAAKKEKGLLEQFRGKCRQHNISITPQRVAIYSILVDAKDHPSAENIYGRVKITFPDISVDTVYRTLSTFSEMGLVDEVEGYGEARRYDPDLKPHHHFRCKKCNKIVDFEDEGLNKLHLPEVISKKYIVSSVKVVAEGLCDECRRK
jgi:Fur family peroxide stress response transcriptional regulator